MSALSMNKQINKKINEISKKQNVANQNVVNGRLTQAKGIVLEQLGNVANDERMRLVGKRDQIAGQIQANYGDKWLVRNRGWLFLSTAIAAVAAFIFLRNSNS
ncbi:MAG: hypothetical protein CL608_14285 [Anaerolineaceae bacterium]|nr:hypothetical protein [Anaerolineaceae bacterium]